MSSPVVGFPRKQGKRARGLLIASLHIGVMGKLLPKVNASISFRGKGCCAHNEHTFLHAPPNGPGVELLNSSIKIDLLTATREDSYNLPSSRHVS